MEGLGATAPGVVGDYFPNEDVDQLAEKPDLCSGARPERHFHFFDAAGTFGSLDQHEQQVDDGTYELIDGDTFRIGNATIGDATFDFTVDGNQLMLHPLITDAQRQQALAHPLEFSTAAWMVAVTYAGTTWKRVPCGGWC